MSLFYACLHQESVGIVERFGKFSKVAEAGECNALSGSLASAWVSYIHVYGSRAPRLMPPGQLSVRKAHAWRADLTARGALDVRPRPRPRSRSPLAAARPWNRIQLLPAGCTCLNPFCGEAVAGVLSLRVQQLDVTCGGRPGLGEGKGRATRGACGRGGTCGHAYTCVWCWCDAGCLRVVCGRGG